MMTTQMTMTAARSDLTAQLTVGYVDYHRDAHGRWRIVASPDVADLERSVGTLLSGALDALSASHAREAELTATIRWALGEVGAFAPLPEGRFPGDGKQPRIGRFWWRTELRKRAALP